MYIYEYTLYTQFLSIRDWFLKISDACTLWWVVQWGNEYLARFKHSATGDAIDELEGYKTWTQKQKAKVAAGFTHTTTAPRSAPGSAPGSAQKASPFVVDSD